MPFAKYEDGLFTKSESRKNLLVPLLFSAALSVLVMVFNLALFLPKSGETHWIQQPGWLFDGMQFGILNFILYSFNRLSVQPRLRRWMNTGLIVWIISAAFDLMDEVIIQPAWVGYYIEDITQLSGMLCVSVGVYHIVHYINDRYADVSIDSFRDELTQLPNRRYFSNVLLDLRGVNYSLFLVDIDHFKSVNDRYGHDQGDEVLRQFGAMLASLYDDNVIAARIGGEEFAVILQTASPEQAEALARDILKRTQALIIDDVIRITVSIGVAQKRENERLEKLLKRVDIALYQAKRQGRNRVEWAPR
ncbi:GGDEF domain-containing protein [Erwinia persicina]|uniref:GGDEF domain-containing protein n=1 Tax=Erwinia persicina TaxID=55211 RepID=UPI001785BE58|nr:GGDEF domain-containing protein [Erwinia persicina]MBD8213396.1 GGDEF domain-containing protein [Erwinia persicina]